MLSMVTQPRPVTQGTKPQCPNPMKLKKIAKRPEGGQLAEVHTTRGFPVPERKRGQLNDKGCQEEGHPWLGREGEGAKKEGTLWGERENEREADSAIPFGREGEGAKKKGTLGERENERAANSAIPFGGKGGIGVRSEDRGPNAHPMKGWQTVPSLSGPMVKGGNGVRSEDRGPNALRSLSSPNPMGEEEADRPLPLNLTLPYLT